MRWTIKASASKHLPTASRFLCKKSIDCKTGRQKTSRWKSFRKSMAVREASVEFYVLFVSEWEGGIGTENQQWGASSAASVKSAFDNTSTLSTSYTGYTDPLDTETHVQSLKDTQSCHTVDMVQHHLHRDTGNALECRSMGLSSCGCLASVLSFILVNVRFNHSKVWPLSRLTVSHKNLLSSHHVILQFCSFRVLILHMCISVTHLSGWHHIAPHPADAARWTERHV